jgi:hypothetical protein
MHDIDRTQVAYSGETESYEMASEAPVLTEAEEMELASELMELETEEEFENFLGDIISGVANVAGGVLGPGAGNALGGLLKGAAKKLLPIAGTIAGGYFGGPAGASIGGKLAGSLAGSLEMEANEQEWEAAKTFVRLAADAARNAALAPEGEDAHVVAQQATVDAAQRHAPELLDPSSASASLPMSQPSARPFAPTQAGHGGPGKHGGCGCGCGHHHRRHHGGQWVRHGHQIVLYGV